MWGRLWAAAWVAAAMAMPSPAMAEAEVRTGNGLLDVCSAEKDVFKIGLCFGFLDAFTDTLGLGAGIGGSGKTGICWPEASTKGQTRDVVVAYLRAHPSTRHAVAVGLTYAALAEAWGCPDARSVTIDPRSGGMILGRPKAPH